MNKNKLMLVIMLSVFWIGSASSMLQSTIKLDQDEGIKTIKVTPERPKDSFIVISTNEKGEIIIRVEGETISNQEYAINVDVGNKKTGESRAVTAKGKIEKTRATSAVIEENARAAQEKVFNFRWKLDGVFRQALNISKQNGNTAALNYLKEKEVQINGDLVKVMVRTTKDGSQKVRINLAQFGAKETANYRNLMNVWVPLNGLEGLIDLPDVVFVHQLLPNYVFVDNIDGVGATLADKWQAKGYKGKGKKIAIIDYNFKGCITATQNGTLSKNQTLKTFADDYNFEDGAISQDLYKAQELGHGTQVAQIICSMCPEASMYLIAINDGVAMFNAIDYCIAEKIDVVNYSAAGFRGGPFDGKALLDQKVNEARDAGVVWVNSVGNYSNSHWSGSFINSGNDNYHNWYTGDVVDTELNLKFDKKEKVLWFFLTWDDWGADSESNLSGADFSLIVTHMGVTVEGGNIIGKPDANTSGNNDQMADKSVYPEEFYTFKSTDNVGYAIKIKANNDACKDKRLNLLVQGCGGPPNLEYNIQKQSFGIPAGAEGAIAVGELLEDKLPQSYKLAVYSSQGPTWDNRIKPDISSFGGPIGGTSGAAPYVAGAAVLVKEKYGYDPKQIQAYLEQHAVQVAGIPKNKNCLVGAGQLMLMDEEVLGANVALQSFSPTYLTAGAINDCKIYGFGFQNGIQVKIEPANDIIVEDVSCQTPNLLKAKIKILPTAIYGPRSIIIVSPDGKTSALENAFDVTWQPIITSLLPNIGMAGEIVSVAIKGDNFIPTPNICLQRWIKPVANSKISYSAKILAKSTNVISSNEISCIFDLSSTQEVGGVKGTTIVIDDLLGAWDLVVSSIYLEGVKPNAFIIVPKPSILSIAPNKVMQGTTVEVEIFGANFQNGALLHCGDGVMIKKYDYSKVPNKLAISAKIGPTAKSGMRDVTVRNPDGGIKTLKNGIEILKLPIVIKKPTTPKIPQYP